MSLTLLALVETLKLPFTAHDIDADTTAQQHLAQITNGTAVPTIIFDDGTALVQPTPEQLVSAIQARLSPPSRGRLWHWTLFAALTRLGIITFGLTFAIAHAAQTVSRC